MARDAKRSVWCYYKCPCSAKTMAQGEASGEESSEQTQPCQAQAIEKRPSSPLDGSHPDAGGVSDRSCRRAAGTLSAGDPSRMDSWASRVAQSARTPPHQGRLGRPHLVSSSALCRLRWLL